MWRGFVHGWAAGVAIDALELDRMVVWAEEWDIDVESLRERLVEMIRPGAVTHVLVRTDASEGLRRALASHGGALHLRRPLRWPARTSTSNSKSWHAPKPPRSGRCSKHRRTVS